MRLCSLFTAAAAVQKKKEKEKNPLSLSLGSNRVASEECTQEDMTAGVQITPPSGKLLLIFLSLSLTIGDPQKKSGCAAADRLQITTQDRLLPSSGAFCYFNSICRCLFTHVVFIIPPPAGHPCPPSALEHAMSSLPALPLNADLKDGYTRFRTVG